MGSFSIFHWLITLLIIANIAMFLHVAVSNRSSGFQKIMWLISLMIIPVIPYLIWRANNFKSQKDITSENRDTKVIKPPHSLSSTNLATHNSNQRMAALNAKSDPIHVDITEQVSIPSTKIIEFNEGTAYTQIAHEIDSQQTDKGLWLKAMIQSNGDLVQQIIIYSGFRLQELRDEFDTLVAEHAEILEISARHAEAAKHTTATQEYINSEKGVCPNCDKAILPLNSDSCPKCRAFFGQGSAWKVTHVNQEKQLEILRAVLASNDKLTDFEEAYLNNSMQLQKKLSERISRHLRQS
jgi:hypothetical protein